MESLNQYLLKVYKLIEGNKKLRLKNEKGGKTTKKLNSQPTKISETYLFLINIFLSPSESQLLSFFEIQTSSTNTFIVHFCGLKMLSLPGY